MSNVPTVSNISQDLTEWQAKHASLVLLTVKVLLPINLAPVKMTVAFSTNCRGGLVLKFLCVVYKSRDVHTCHVTMFMLLTFILI